MEDIISVVISEMIVFPFLGCGDMERKWDSLFHKSLWKLE